MLSYYQSIYETRSLGRYSTIFRSIPERHNPLESRNKDVIKRVNFLKQPPGEEKEKELINSLLELLSEEQSTRMKQNIGLLPPPYMLMLASIAAKNSKRWCGEGPGRISLSVGGGRQGEEALRKASRLPQTQTNIVDTWAKGLVGVAGVSSLSKILYDYRQKSEREK